MTETYATATPAQQSTAELILPAAPDLFAKRPFPGSPVPLLAERAGVAAGTIYRYFPSKEALLNAVYQRWKGELRRRLLEEQPSDAEPAEAFRHWWRSLVAFVREHPVAFEFLELHHHEPYLDETSRALAGEIDLAALAFTGAGQASGVIRADQPAPTLVALVYGALTGLFRARRLYPDVVADEAFDETEALLWQMLTTVPESTPAYSREPTNRPSQGDERS